ncbi:MAG: hypothetical protein KAQ68_09195 [Clostridiales bacterium]|nr:hypothetical protein [Clostridiales bacterium]
MKALLAKALYIIGIVVVIIALFATVFFIFKKPIMSLFNKNIDITSPDSPFYANQEAQESDTAIYEIGIDGQKFTEVLKASNVISNVPIMLPRWLPKGYAYMSAEMSHAKNDEVIINYAYSLLNGVDPIIFQIESRINDQSNIVIDTDEYPTIEYTKRYTIYMKTEEVNGQTITTAKYIREEVLICMTSGPVDGATMMRILRSME